MKLGTRSAIQTTILSLVAIVVVTVVLNYQLREHAVEMAEHEAQLILNEKLATLTFVTNDLHPAISTLLRDKKTDRSSLDPALMSPGYVNRMVMKYFGKDGGQGYYFKNAAINARNPDNEADPREAAFLRELRGNPDATLSEVREIDGKPYLIFMQSNPLRFTEACMECHSLPENAPENFLQQYGRERSFNKAVGEIPSVMSLRIPLNETFFYVHPITFKLSVIMAFLLAASLLAHWFVTKRYIFKPLARITDKARSITSDPSKLGEEIVISGKGELTEMAEVFSNMSTRLAERRSELEELVEERTSQLDTANRLLEESEHHFRTLFQNAPLPYQSLDSEGHLLEVNDVWLNYLGYSREEVVGRFFGDFLTPKMKEFFEQKFPLFKKEGSICGVEFELQTKNRSTLIVQFIGRIAHDSRNNFSRTHCIFRDITNEKQIEKEKKILEKQLRQALKMEAIGTLAGGIAHDFNNILAAIIGYAEMAREETPESSTAWKDINEVLKAGRRARDLVKHILSFSRMSEYDDMVTINLKHIAREVLELLRASIPATITIEQNIDRTCGNILADPTQIHQVIMNICTNAAHAMDDEGGAMIISISNANLGGEDLLDEPDLVPGAYVMLSVSDTGCGITPDIIDKIFDPYFTTKGVGKGSGMGLAVVHGIVTKHGGMIKVDSIPGQGSEFRVYFPQILTETHQEKPGENEPAIRGGNERILVVDDEESIITVISQRLRKQGYRVFTETSSTRAYEMFRENPGAFDLIITDQTMPGMTGEQLSREILSIRAETPIIICTGYSAKMDMEKALDMGIRAFIMKPVENRELAMTVRKVLDDRDESG